MGRHLLTPKTPVRLAHDHDSNEEDWPAAPPRSTFRVVARLVRPKRNRMATDYNLRARQLLRYAAADPALPHADIVTDEHMRRARFLQPLYEPGADADEGEGEEKWPAQWEETARSLRGFVGCRPWKEATEGYLLQEVEDVVEDVVEDQEPPAPAQQQQQQPDNEAQDTRPNPNLSGMGSVLNLSGLGTVPLQTTPVKPAPPGIPRRPRHMQTQQTLAASGSRLPVPSSLLADAAGRGRGRGAATKPLTPVTTDLYPPLGATGAFPPLGQMASTVTSRVEDATHPDMHPLTANDPSGETPAAVPGAFPSFGETHDTPAALFSSAPNVFGRERDRSRANSRSVSPKGGNNNPVPGGGGFTEEEMARFRAWVAREERKKAREAGGK
ncbi:hypothetical protein CcaCcLH18_11325 [Colletotrichum camelliae]|nr:hypothetical protein CcaCcLH18_11325 [Colletotrichum camelliae]